MNRHEPSDDLTDETLVEFFKLVGIQHNVRFNIKQKLER